MRALWVLRILALAVLAFLLAKPVVVRPDTSGPSRWAVLLDSSKSMGVSDPVRRIDQARQLASLILKKLPGSELFEFSGDVKPITNVSSVSANGRQTDIGMALKKVLGEGRFKGAVVLTDGQQVGRYDPLSEAASAGRPLLTVGFGNATFFKDVAVRSIQCPPFAFKNVPASVSATIGVVGFPGKRITVRLREGNNVLGVQTIQPIGQDVETAVNFTWVPRSLGTKTLTVETDSYEGEITTANNRKDALLDVGRDRFRVLYICGVPGPEYSFLRHQFKSDPAVELITFVILRNAMNVLTVPDSELSLIPFPTQDILINQMPTFDLIVFEEFQYPQYGLLPAVMYAVRKKVEEGGSFLITGGRASFGFGSGYGLPGIYDMIPVQFGGSDVPIAQGPLAFEPKAPNHPILRLDQNSVANEKIWKNLPGIEDVALLPGVKPSATVLGTVSNGGRSYPVLTAWRYGKGRVAVLSTRTTWRWSMLSGKQYGTSFAYQQFWKNMVLWLTHADEFKQVRIGLDSKQLKEGEPAAVRVWTYDEYFKPISDVDLHLRVSSPDHHQQELEVHPETQGVFVASFKPDQLGDFELEAWVDRHGKKLGSDRLSFRAVESHLEEEDLRPNSLLLKEMARETGGRYVSADDFSVSLLDDFDREVSGHGGRKVLLWDSPYALAFLSILLAVEWLIRRRRGLP